MNRGAVGATLVAATTLISSALAQDDQLAQGEKLYVRECSVCHGLVAQAATGNRRPWQRGVVRLAAQQSVGLTRRDLLDATASESTLPLTTPGFSSHGSEDAMRIAVAPPYGPHLRGIYGRAAGTVDGFNYSNAFVKALKGMEWNESALEVWITNPQKWVPGVYMFYKQPDAEVRRKIILYLKANP